LDKLFWLLLTLPVPVIGGAEAEEVNIVVEDVLGPLVSQDQVGERDPIWSLLHYSINLNPAMRQQIAADSERYVSSSELMRINEDGETVHPTSLSSLSKHFRRCCSFKSLFVVSLNNFVVPVTLLDFVLFDY